MNKVRTYIICSIAVISGIHKSCEGETTSVTKYGLFRLFPPISTHGYGPSTPPICTHTFIVVYIRLSPVCGATLTINFHFAERHHFCNTIAVDLYEEISAFDDLVAHQRLYGGWKYSTVHEADTVGRLFRTCRYRRHYVCQADREVMQALN